MELSKALLNSARLRILQYIYTQERVNTSSIVAALPDIPRATVYHHIKILEESNLIEVVEENRVRNTIEKIYASCKNNITTTGDNPIQLSGAFYMALLEEFNRYFSSPDADPKRDQVVFTSAYLAVTNEEYSQLLTELSALIKRFAALPKTAERELRKLSIISSPPENGVNNNNKQGVIENEFS